MTTLAYHITHAGERVSIENSPPGAAGVATVVEMPSNAEMLMALAKAEKPCPGRLDGKKGFHFGVQPAPPGCPLCGGKDLIPRFPLLREPCPVAIALNRGPNNYEIGDSGHPPINCSTCRGRGWVPIQHDVVEKLEALCYETRKVGEERYVRLHENSTEYRGPGETPLSRLLSAIVLATAAEEEKP